MIHELFITHCTNGTSIMNLSHLGITNNGLDTVIFGLEEVLGILGFKDPWLL